MEVLVNNIVEVAKDCPAMTTQANQVKELFSTVLNRFAKCHQVYNGNELDTVNINQLGKPEF